MPQLGTDNINLKDGRTLTEVLEGLGTGETSTPVDLKNYAKTSDLKAVKDMIEQLVVDLKAGKYAITGETKVEEVKETKTSK